MQLRGLRGALNKLLFGLSTWPGKIFNIIIIVLILAAVFLSMLATIPEIDAKRGELIDLIQFWLLVSFAIEYFLRLYAAPVRMFYVKSFVGIVDLITIVPLFIGIEGSVLIRLLRLARVIKIVFYLPVVKSLMISLRGSHHMLFGVLVVISLISILMGNLIFILEPETYENAFEGAWWSLVTMSTVGYGDLVPQTAEGRLIATFLIFSGISTFAMVTAVVSVSVGRLVNAKGLCVACKHEIVATANFCEHCGCNQHN